MSEKISEATRQEVYARIDRRFDEFVEDLRAYARVPTISARREAEAEGAEATLALLGRHGVEARLMEVPGGPPMVVGEVPGPPGAPTLILYNHYDVQPVDPIEQWRRAPFDPVVEDGKLFARGVADTKGNTAAQAVAQATVRDVVGTVPVNLRFMVEGEEEVGSPHLSAFARQHPDLFRAQGRRSRARDTRRKGSRKCTWAARAFCTSSCASGRRPWTSTARSPRRCPIRPGGSSTRFASSGTPRGES